MCDSVCVISWFVIVCVMLWDIVCDVVCYIVCDGVCDVMYCIVYCVLYCMMVTQHGGCSARWSLSTMVALHDGRSA